MIYLRILLEAVLYLFGQVYVFQNLMLAEMAVPKPFLVFILFLPMRLPTPVGLVFSFLFGLALDIFIQPFGAHAFACVLLFYVRGYWANAVSSSTIYDTEEVLDLGLEARSFSWLLSYLLPLVFLYELVYNILSDYTLSLRGLMEVGSSGLYTLLLALALGLIIYRKH